MALMRRLQLYMRKLVLSSKQSTPEESLHLFLAGFQKVTSGRTETRLSVSLA